MRTCITARCGLMVGASTSSRWRSVSSERDVEHDRWTKLSAALHRHLDQYGDVHVGCKEVDTEVGTGEAIGNAVSPVCSQGYLIPGLPGRRLKLADMGFDFGMEAADVQRRVHICKSRAFIADMLEIIAKHGTTPKRRTHRREQLLFFRWQTSKRQNLPSCMTDRIDAALRAAQQSNRQSPLDSLLCPRAQ